MIDEINALLPQTQCKLCQHEGCKPYAQAISEGTDTIDKCAPGGIETLLKLAQITQQDPSPYLAHVAQNAKPPMLAIIREAECIGCTKCIQACPVDAIIGTAKHMHSIINDQCTGCELCIPPCPVDCIDMITLPPTPEHQKATQATQYQAQYDRRNQRLAQQAQVKKNQHQQAKSTVKLSAIAAAVARAKGRNGAV